MAKPPYRVWTFDAPTGHTWYMVWDHILGRRVMLTTNKGLARGRAARLNMLHADLKRLAAKL